MFFRYILIVLRYIVAWWTGVPSSEEESFSIMFNSLKHPARRKILRMLSERKLTFSQMLEELTIPSSHLTYHLENLSELVIKDGDGKYELSSFGKASVSVMKSAKEVPDIHKKRFSVLPRKWKWLYAVFIIAIVFMASLAYVQYASYDRLLNDYATLKIDLDQTKAENQQLLEWSTSSGKAMTMIRDVMQIDLPNYQATLLSDKVEQRLDLGGAIEEVMRYSLVNNQSRIELTLRFRNAHFSLLQVTQLEGLPNFPLVYTQPQPRDVVQACQGLFDRYRFALYDSYMDEVTKLLTSANESSNGQTLGNTKLQISSYGDSADVLLLYTVNGMDFEAKSLHVVFQNHVVTEFSDDWFLYQIGSTQATISQDQAVLIAKNAAKNYSWNANGTQVTNFEILDNPVSAQFYPHPKTENLTLYPYWYVTLYLDKTYPGGVSEIAVGVWADTGQVANIQALSGQLSS